MNAVSRGASLRVTARADPIDPSHYRRSFQDICIEKPAREYPGRPFLDVPSCSAEVLIRAPARAAEEAEAAVAADTCPSPKSPTHPGTSASPAAAAAEVAEAEAEAAVEAEAARS